MPSVSFPLSLSASPLFPVLATLTLYVARCLSWSRVFWHSLGFLLHRTRLQRLYSPTPPSERLDQVLLASLVLVFISGPAPSTVSRPHGLHVSLLCPSVSFFCPSHYSFRTLLQFTLCILPVPTTTKTISNSHCMEFPTPTAALLSCTTFPTTFYFYSSFFSFQFLR